MLFPNTEHQRLNISFKSVKDHNGGSCEYVLGMYALVFVLIMALASMQVMRYKAGSDITEDALAASALAALDADPYIYGQTHSIIINDPRRARGIFESALRDNMKLNDSFEPKGSDPSYIKGRVTVDDFRVYKVEGDRVTEYTVGNYTVTENEGVYGEMTTPSGKDVRSAGVYAEISYEASGFLGISVNAGKNTYVEMMANPDMEHMPEDP